MVNYTARTEVIYGSSFSGTSGDTGRSYVLANPGAISQMFTVMVQGTPLSPTVEFTNTSTTVTILNPLDDGFLVVLNYLTLYNGVTGTAYTTPDLVNVEIRAEAAFSSTTVPSLDTVENWISEESAVIDLMTNSVYSSNLVSSEYVDYDGDPIFRFPTAPVIGVDLIEYNIYNLGQTPSWISLEEGFDKNYLVYSSEGEIEFIPGLNATNRVMPKPGLKRLRVTYRSGYASVPMDIQKLATLMTAKRVIMSLINGQANEEGGAIQVGTISVSDPSNYSVNYLKSLNTEIDTLAKGIGRGFTTYRNSRVYNL